MAVDTLELAIIRFGFGRESTIGVLQIDGMHECWTLEDERRRVKKPGETCIPTGRFPLILRPYGGLHKKYATRFPGLHQGMLWLQNVPDFEYIYVHIGNDESDTDGCPLVGKYPMMLPDGEFKVADSTEAYKTLYKKVLKALGDGLKVYVTVKEVEPQ